MKWNKINWNEEINEMKWKKNLFAEMQWNEMKWN